ncbi:hypothetical protein E4U25_005313 [Claviceps purpurea]|nr:hypothetical protein E4U25_005313 [Claviceps purpurea]
MTISFNFPCVESFEQRFSGDCNLQAQMQEPGTVPTCLIKQGERSTKYNDPMIRYDPLDTDCDEDHKVSKSSTCANSETAVVLESYPFVGCVQCSSVG